MGICFKLESLDHKANVVGSNLLLFMDGRWCGVDGDISECPFRGRMGKAEEGVMYVNTDCVDNVRRRRALR